MRVRTENAIILELNNNSLAPQTEVYTGRWERTCIQNASSKDSKVGFQIVSEIKEDGKTEN